MGVAAGYSSAKQPCVWAAAQERLVAYIIHVHVGLGTGLEPFAPFCTVDIGGWSLVDTRACVVRDGRDRGLCFFPTREFSCHSSYS